MRQMSRVRVPCQVCLLAGSLLTLSGCASLRPKLEVAREDFVQACRDYTSALVGDTHPSQVELIVQKVCLAEAMAEKITSEVKQDAADVLAPFPDAGSQQ